MLLAIADELTRDLKALRFGQPVRCVYNPLDYARASYAAYVDRYGEAPKKALFLGMNPGPFGMAQTGVPFGDVSMVRDWLGIKAPVGKPPQEHPKRPVLGFACERSEVSGTRLWGWARDRFGTPERFFRDFFVANYCPLVFMEESGANRTPDKLGRSEREAVFAACDRALRRTVEHLRPSVVIGVGAFAEERAKEALVDLPLTIARMLHPSPASPLANRNWAGEATATLERIGLLESDTRAS